MEKFIVALKQKFPGANQVNLNNEGEFEVHVGDEYNEATYFYKIAGNKLIHFATISVDAD